MSCQGIHPRGPGQELNLPSTSKFSKFVDNESYILGVSLSKTFQASNIHPCSNIFTSKSPPKYVTEIYPTGQCPSSIRATSPGHMAAFPSTGYLKEGIVARAPGGLDFINRSICVKIIELDRSGPIGASRPCAT
jgi:hypothetical protein